MRKILITSLILLCLLMVNQAGAYDLILDNFALGKSAAASDIGYSWQPERAVDGDTGTGYHSLEDDSIDHWLEIDLGEPMDFQRIEVVNRSGFLSRLNGAVVVALDADRQVVYTSSAVNNSPAVFQCNAKFAAVQYIRVEQSGLILTVMELRALSIREVPYIPMGSNLTQFGAIATEEVAHASYPASNAIDGNYTNFSHTDQTTPNNYWQVELAEEFYIEKLVIYNRTSCCGERLLNQVVTVSDELGNEIFYYKFTDPNEVFTGSVHTIELPSPTYGKFVKIGLENGEANGQEGGDNFVVSLAEVEVIGASFQGAWDPTPSDGDVEVDVDQDLSWRPGEDPNGLVPGTTGYVLYFSDDESAVIARDPAVKQNGIIAIGSETYDPGTLAKDTTYYWAVDQRFIDDANSIEGRVWSFTTPLTLPIIDTQPADDMTIIGGYAVFTVTATDPLGGELTYAWHKVGSSEILSTTDTLEVIDVAAEDAGEYVCDVMNINFIQTQPATLVLANKVVEWKFNESTGTVAADSSGNGIDGTVSGLTDDEWIVDGGRTGSAGDNAIYFPGTEGASVEALDVDLTTKPVNNIFLGDSSWTINIWLNVTSTTGISMVGGFGDNEYVEGSGLNDRAYDIWDGTVEFNYGHDDDGFWYTEYTAGQWQQWTLTYDAATTVLTYYRDGVAIETKTASLADVTENAFKLGSGVVAWAGENQVPLDAMIDDFSVWDGALGPFEVGMLYKGYGCTEDIPGDINGDCKVDMLDLAVATDNWMDCGMIPVSECP